jgi:hypothetical protein
MPRPTIATRWLTGVLLCSASLSSATAAQAKDQERLRLRSLAATCAQCR